MKIYRSLQGSYDERINLFKNLFETKRSQEIRDKLGDHSSGMIEASGKKGIRC